MRYHHYGMTLVVIVTGKLWEEVSTDNDECESPVATSNKIQTKPKLKQPL